jgi:hypothetical protein
MIPSDPELRAEEARGFIHGLILAFLGTVKRRAHIPLCASRECSK